MSSIAYSVEITPDPTLRRIVLYSGALLGVAGILAILTLPLDSWARLALALGWVATSLFELRQLRRAWHMCHRLRLDSDGKIELLDADGQWQVGSLVSGGVLLRKTGWIRLQIHGGGTFGELLAGDSRTSRDWRRLQVIWRHVGA